MRTIQNISYFRIFCNDFIAAFFLLLLFVMAGTMVSAIITGDRITGMVYGFTGGIILGFIVFYYFRGYFNFLWTVLQLAINAGLTVGEFSVVSYLLSDTTIAKISYGFVLVFISIPTLISINKQLLDNLTKKLNAKRRIKQPLQIFNAKFDKVDEDNEN